MFLTRIYILLSIVPSLIVYEFLSRPAFGELASLTFDDFDLDRNVVKIYKTESKFYERGEDGTKLGVMVYVLLKILKRYTLSVKYLSCQRSS